MRSLRPFFTIMFALLIGAGFFAVGSLSAEFWPATGALIPVGIILGLTVRNGRTDTITQAWDIFLRSVLGGVIAGLLFTACNLWGNFFYTTPTYDFLSMFLLVANAPGAYLATIWIRRYG